MASLIGSLKQLNPQSPALRSFLGPSVSEQINTRSGERTQRMGMESAAAGMPSYWETWGQRLQQVGSTLAGASAGGSDMGIPGGGGSGYSRIGNGSTLSGDFGGGTGWD